MPSSKRHGPAPNAEDVLVETCCVATPRVLEGEPSRD